jgi:hypothetical protein
MITQALKYYLFAICIIILLTVSIVNTTQAATGHTTAVGMFNDDMLKTVIKDTQTLGPGDEVTVYIESGGGYVYVQEAIIAYFKFKKLSSVCYVGRSASSAAATLLVECDKQIVADNAEIMFHLPYVKDEEGNIVRTAAMSTNFLVKHGFAVQRALNAEQYARFIAGEDVTITGLQFKLNMGIK